jgi:hypothetical protein
MSIKTLQAEVTRRETFVAKAQEARNRARSEMLQKIEAFEIAAMQLAQQCQMLEAAKERLESAE